MPAHARNLIISPIGNSSVHGSWSILSAARTYDLLLINYSNQPGFGAADATHYLERKGMKWELLTHALDMLPEVVARYTNVWLPDDDIRTSPSEIDRLFAIFEDYRLQMAQPAIAAGEVSYKVFRQRPGVILRDAATGGTHVPAVHAGGTASGRSDVRREPIGLGLGRCLAAAVHRQRGGHH